MGTLVITQANDSGGRFRRMRVYVDQAEVAGLKPNELQSYELPSGAHTVSGKMDWPTGEPLRVDVPTTGLVRV